MVCRSDRHESGGGRPPIHSGGHREASVGFGWNLFNRAEDPTMLHSPSQASLGTSSLLLMSA